MEFCQLSWCVSVELQTDLDEKLKKLQNESDSVTSLGKRWSCVAALLSHMWVEVQFVWQVIGGENTWVWFLWRPLNMDKLKPDGFSQMQLHIWSLFTNNHTVLALHYKITVEFTKPFTILFFFTSGSLVMWKIFVKKQILVCERSR